MEILTSLVRILSWGVFLLGVYCDLFSLYCIVRVAINPCFRMSPVPIFGLIMYLMAETLGFPYRCVLLVFCCLDILMTLLCFIVGRYFSSSKRKHKNISEISGGDPCDTVDVIRSVKL